MVSSIVNPPGQGTDVRAAGWRTAWRDIRTDTIASCSRVTPYRPICHRAHLLVAELDFGARQQHKASAQHSVWLVHSTAHSAAHSTVHSQCTVAAPHSTGLWWITDASGGLTMLLTVHIIVD